jgi:formylglycine-generating enzyme required for sulfatase activity
VIDTAKVPFEVNVAATVKAIKSGEITSKEAAARTETTLAVPITSFLSGAGGNVGVLSGARGRLGAPAIVSGRDGKVSVKLSAPSYKNAEVLLYAINGKLMLRGKAFASGAAASVRRDLTAGVYLLSVKGAGGDNLSSRVTHRGGSLALNVELLNETVTPVRQLAKESAEGDGNAWHISVTAPGFEDSIFSLNLQKGLNPKQTITLRQAQRPAKASFTETLGSNNVALDMVYIPGGTFTLGCEKSSGCPADAKPVTGVQVSSYFIGKGEVTNDQWFAVMGWYKGYNGKSTTRPGCINTQYCDRTGSAASITWYEALEFACKLSQITGKKYRMVTEAEWEYAAKKHLSSLSNIGGGSGVGGEEWAYNTWSSTHMGGTDPIGPNGSLEKLHTQKTRRDANTGGDNITSRLIRSIEGVGPALRLAISADMDYPPGMPATCDIRIPELGDEPENSYRDMRWVTGGDKRWAVPSGSTAIGSFDLRVWEDGTASVANSYPANSRTAGQWFTSNNMAFVFVPNSGSSRTYKYIFVTLKDASLICDMDYSNYSSGAYIGRIIKEEATHVDKPAIAAGLKSGAELAAAAGDDYKMIDMGNIPASAKKQDARLLDGGATMGWFQNNSSAGGVHHYRKDVDPDEFRFTVNQNNGRTTLANGEWFTVNNIFLRVTHSGGYTVDYLYAVTGEGASATFYHNSFQGYERGDFRMFKKETNGSAWPTTTCGNICSEEIPKGLEASMYARMDNGQSTFVPAKCPAGGCR